MQEKEAPLISVLMAVKNEELYLEDAVNSLCKQSWVNWETIIVDDLSEDSTFALATRLSENESRVKVLRNINTGKVGAYNTAFSQATGKYFVFFAGDDLLTENSLRDRVSGLFNRPLGACSYGKLKTFSASSKYDSVEIPRTGVGKISGGGVMFDRELADFVFPIPSTLPNEDTWTRLCLEYFSNYHCPLSAVVLRYRIHENNSHRRGVGFDSTSAMLSKRHAAVQIFYDLNKKRLSDKSLELLRTEIICGNLRSEGNLLGLLMLRIPLRKKLAALATANKYIFKIKMRFFRFFTGR